MGSTRFGRVIFASAILAWGCSSTGTGQNGTGGSTGAGTGGSTSSTGGTTATGGTTSSGTGGSVSATGGTTGGGTGGGGPATGGTTGGGGGGAAAATGGTAGGNAGGRTGTAGAGAGTGGSAGSTSAGGGSSGGVTVQLASTKQTIEGFGLNTALGGGSFNWDNLFGTSGTDAIGLSIVRVGMNSDGSLSGDVSGAKSHNAKVIGSVWTAPASGRTTTTRTRAGT